MILPSVYFIQILTKTWKKIDKLLSFFESYIYVHKIIRAQCVKVIWVVGIFDFEKLVVKKKSKGHKCLTEKNVKGNALE